MVPNFGLLKHALRSLSVELYNSKLTVEEAKQGHTIIQAFIKLGVSPEEHLALIKVCHEIADPGFAQAALLLSQIESSSGKSYHELISDFEKASIALPQLKAKIAEIKEEIESANDELMKKQQELFSIQQHLEKYQAEVKTKEAALGKELSEKIKKSEIDNKEIEEVVNLKTELAKKGLNLQSLIKIGKEFSHGSKGN